MLRDYITCVRAYFNLAPLKTRYLYLSFLISGLNKAATLLYIYAGAMLIGFLSTGDKQQTINALIWLLSAAIVSSFTFYLRRAVESLSGEYVYRVLIASVREKLFNIDHHLVKHIDKGRLLGSVSTDIINIGSLGAALAEIGTSFLQIVLAIIIIGSQNLIIAAILTIFSILYLLLRNYADHRVMSYNVKNTVSDDKYSNLIRQTLNGLKEVRTFNMFLPLREQLSSVQQDYRKQYIFRRRYTLMRDNDLMILVYLFQFLLYAVLIFLISQQRLGVAVLVLAISYQTYIVNYMDGLIVYAAQFRSISNSITRINDILSYETKNISYGNLEMDDRIGAVEFKNINFNDRRKKVVHDINFKINHNQIFAITGEVGAGKTTLMNLLLRLSKPKTGSIMIDGVDIFKFSPKAYAKKVAITDEDPFVFNVSIRRNFDMVNPNRREQLRVCKMVGIHNLISNLPRGYNTIIRENGKNISAGQQQLIALARTILTGAEIILLDGVSKPLDTAMLSHIIDLLHILKEDHTIILATKNLEILQNADKVLFLKDGRIVDLSTHKQLMRKSKSYRDFIDANINRGSLEEANV